MRHPHDVLGPENVKRLREQLGNAEKELAVAEEQYRLFVQAGIAKAEMNVQLQDARRRVAQMKAAFQL